MEIHPRQISIQNGEKKYHGKPCKNCGSTLKYTCGMHCVECLLKRNDNKRKTIKNYRQKHDRAYNLKKKYGMSLEDYDRMCGDQNGLCFICEEPSSKLVVDHCHNTGKVRRLLCNNCNTGIGLLRNEKNLKNAAKYLRKHR
jgi:hypothetical protein